MKVFIVIPAFNEEKTLSNVLFNVKKNYQNIVVVNDGSSDATQEIAERNQVIVCSHIINRGLGGALGTGIKKALMEQADIIVTFDADGQHQPDDIARLIDPILRGRADVVVGSRMHSSSGMPWLRKMYNGLGNIITYLLFGMKVSDSQSGLRAFSRQAAYSLDLRANKMEVSSEIIREVKINKLKYLEIPIKAIYTDYSLSKGQGFFVGVKTFIKLVVLRILK